MILARLKPPIPVKNISRCFSTIIQPEESTEEYTTSPIYPEILDLSYDKKMERRKDAEHEAIKDVPTVEEKQIKLNMPRYYGFLCYMVPENEVPYNGLNYIQHITRTHLITDTNLPNYYNNVNIENVDLKNEVEEAILVEIEGYKRIHELKKQDEINEFELEDLISGAVCRQLNRAILNRTSQQYPHLLKSAKDYDGRIETFWYAGGMDPTNKVRNRRKKLDFMAHSADEPLDRGFVYLGSPSITIRSELPLPFVIPPSDCTNPDFTIPHFKYDPRVIGAKIQHRHMANVPGFWPSDPYQFGLLSYHNRGHLLQRLKRFDNAQDDQEALHYQGILASFGWLHAQANNLGFNTFNDVTYPLVTQTVITNGQKWSFYTYQLNTTLIHSKYYKENPKRNICWATPEMKLFDKIENGKLEGLNEQVLSNLLKFYCNVPAVRLGVNLRPYLKTDVKIASEYEDDDKRVWLEREYKHLMSNRPKHVPIDEIWNWEEIYKIRHQTRFMDKKLRFFELFQRPQARKLNDRLAEYIPRKLRPDCKRWQGRYKNEYWP